MIHLAGFCPTMIRLGHVLHALILPLNLPSKIFPSYATQMYDFVYTDLNSKFHPRKTKARLDRFLSIND